MTNNIDHWVVFGNTSLYLRNETEMLNDSQYCIDNREETDVKNTKSKIVILRAFLCIDEGDIKKGNFALYLRGICKYFKNNLNTEIIIPFII